MKNWFEKHPAKTITVFVVVLLLLIITGLEKILAVKNKHSIRYSEGINRVVTLREHNPFTVQEIYPDTAFQQQHSHYQFQDKYLIRIDKDGFIFPSRKHDNPDVSIVFLGASTTECLFNEERCRFPYLVGEQLEKETGLRVNAYNGGKGGNNSLHSINILLNKVTPMKPDIVVMKHNMNDLVILLLEKTYWNDNPKRSPIISLSNTPRLKEYIHRKLSLLMPELAFELKRFTTKNMKIRGVRNEFKHLHGTRITIDKNKLTKEFKTNLFTFVALCKTRGILPVLMTQASRLTEAPDEIVRKMTSRFEHNYGLEHNEFKELFDLFNQVIREVGVEKDVAVINLDKNIPKDGENIFDLIHYTDTGSRYAASIISRQLLTMIK